MSIGEVACTYATMILHDDGIPITAEKIAILVKSSNVSVESYWPTLFAKLAEKRNMDDLILNVGSSGSAAPVAAAAVPIGGAAAAAEEKNVLALLITLLTHGFYMEYLLEVTKEEKL